MTILIVKGEFSNNKKHGFGVATYGEGRKYFGRFEEDCMSGVGIYCHPNVCYILSSSFYSFFTLRSI